MVEAAPRQAPVGTVTHCFLHGGVAVLVLAPPLASGTLQLGPAWYVTALSSHVGFRLMPINPLFYFPGLRDTRVPGDSSLTGPGRCDEYQTQGAPHK